LEDPQLFCPDQIICIESDELRLFAEVIQVIPERDRLWARPLALAAQDGFNLKLLHDLRSASQLILPPALFRPAYDTEVIPVMSELFQREMEFKLESTTELNGWQALHAFMANLWPKLIAS
jgi:hypothetical protein